MGRVRAPWDSYDPVLLDIPAKHDLRRRVVCAFGDLTYYRIVENDLKAERSIGGEDQTCIAAGGDKRVLVEIRVVFALIGDEWFAGRRPILLFLADLGYGLWLDAVAGITRARGLDRRRHRRRGRRLHHAPRNGARPTGARGRNRVKNHSPMMVGDAKADEEMKIASRPPVRALRRSGCVPRRGPPQPRFRRSAGGWRDCICAR